MYGAVMAVEIRHSLPDGILCASLGVENQVEYTDCVQ